MRRILLIIVVIAMAAVAHALDIITKTDGTRVEAKVLNITPTEIQYKKHSNLEGPTYTVPLSSVRSITYANGETENFNSSSGQVVETTGGSGGGSYIPQTYANSNDGSFGTTVSEYAQANTSDTYDSYAVQRANSVGGSGRLKITLLWDDTNDLDLIVNQPDGQYVYFANKTNSSTGAQMGSDAFGGANSYESITWTNPSTGTYDVFVRVRGTVPGNGEIVKVVIQAGSDTKVYTTRITKSGSDSKDVRMCRYYYSGSGGSGSSYIPTTTYRSSEARDYWVGNTVNKFIDAETTTAYDSEAVSQARSSEGSGPLKFTLLWYFSNDCDLVANQADGTDIYFGNRTDSTYGGTFHGDDFGGSGVNMESVSWTRPSSGGLYDAFIRVRGGSVTNGLVKLVVEHNGNITVYSTRVNKSGNDNVDIRLANITY